MIKRLNGEHLYRTFHKFDPKFEDEINIDLNSNDTFVQLGTVINLTYRSDKWDGVLTDYIHSFKKKPRLITNSNGNILLLADGNFSITARGILK